MRDWSKLKSPFQNHVLTVMTPHDLHNHAALDAIHAKIVPFKKI